MNFVTDDNYKGSCSKEIKINWKAEYTVQYDFLAQTATSNGFDKMDYEKIKQTKVVWITEIPTKLKLKLQSIDPKTSDTKVSVMFDGQPKVYTTIDEYLFDIRDSEPHTIQLKIEDTKRWLSYEENKQISASPDIALAFWPAERFLLVLAAAYIYRGSNNQRESATKSYKNKKDLC